MNGLDLLRWVLLLIGAAILVGIYLAGRRSLGARRRARRARASAPPDPYTAEAEADAAARDAEPLTEIDRELADLGHSIRLEEGRAAARAAAERETVIPVSVDDEPASAPPADAPVEGTDEEGATKLIALFVMAREGHQFRGVDIRAAAQAAGLEYGDMRIYHRRHESDPKGRALFSMANVVEPGWFDLEAMDELQTPGLALFMQRPGPMAGTEAFDTMVAAARVLQTRLQGELRDASRSVLSQQTIEHLRDEIREFERRRYAAARSAR